MVEPAALHRGAARLGRRRPAPALRRRGRGDLPRPTAQRLEAAGLVDAELFAWRALDALRRDARSLGLHRRCSSTASTTSPPLELDALETLATRCGADVTVSLPYERGRRRVQGRGGDVRAAVARSPASAPIELPALDDHYAPSRATALHHLERGLFADAATPARAGGAGAAAARPAAQRAEVELVAAEVLDAAARGHRSRATSRWSSATRARYAVAGRAGLRRLRDPVLGRPPHAARATRRSAAGCSRCCAAPRLDGTARRPARLPAHARPAAQPARWPTGSRPTSARPAPRPPPTRASCGSERALAARRDRPAGRDAAAGPGAADRRAARPARAAVLRALPARARTCWTAPSSTTRASSRPRHRRSPSCGDLRRAGPRDGPRRRRAARHCWRSCDVRARRAPAARPRAGGHPGAIRARRFEAVFVCGLQEGEFPRGRRRRAVPARTTTGARSRRPAGWRCPCARTELDRERYLFYVCASRAERAALPQLALQRRGGQSRRPGSFFLEDVRDLFDGRSSRAARSLSDVTWAPRGRPDRGGVGARARGARARARRRSRARRAHGTPAAASGSASADAFSASALETFADCPVKWLVERVLRPEALEPDPEQMVRGGYAHDVLELTYAALREQTGAARVSRARTSPRPSGSCARRCASEQSSVPALAEPDARARGGAAARVRPAALPAPRGRARRGVRAGRARAALRHAGRPGCRRSRWRARGSASAA